MWKEEIALFVLYGSVVYWVDNTKWIVLSSQKQEDEGKKPHRKAKEILSKNF